MTAQLFDRKRLIDLWIDGKDRGETPVETMALASLYRYRGSFEALWKSHVNKPQQLDPWVAGALTVACFEIAHAARTKIYGTVDGTVGLVGKRVPHQKGLVNAVLRKVAKSLEPTGAGSSWTPSVEADFPAWISQSWSQSSPPEVVFSRLRALLDEPVFVVGNEPSLREVSAVKDYLESCRATGERPRIQSYASRFVVDLTAQMGSQLLSEQPPGANLLIWDACAGKGGKLIPLLDDARLASSATFLATDVSKESLALLENSLEQMGFPHNRITVRNQPIQSVTIAADLILLDSPCTGSGTWNKNPKGKWACTEETVASLSALQQDLLEATWRQLKPGGILVYSVCSLFEAETSAHFFPTMSLAGADTVKIHVESQWTQRLKPGMAPSGGLFLEPKAGCDGFYVHGLRKRADKR